MLPNNLKEQIAFYTKLTDKNMAQIPKFPQYYVTNKGMVWSEEKRSFC